MYFGTVVLVSLALNAGSVSCKGVDLSRYIIEVSSTCNSVRGNRPILKILTDYSISAVARCAQGDQNFTTIDGVHYILPASYIAGNNRCLFYRRGNTFAVDVAVLYGDSSAKLLRHEKMYTISCTFDKNGKQSSGGHKVVEGRMPGQQIQINTGKQISSSSLSLSLQNVNNIDLKGSTLPDNTWVSLFAKSNGANKERGIRATSCDAVGGKKGKGKRYAVLRAGCGDGQIFKKQEGFITVGRTSRSPYFKPFYVEGDKFIDFVCNFTICSSSCDGSSCKPN
ncbi:hypothetical protein SNE40_001411 [Patella caerulea]|uniref:ZP domain-containing protein n=1 Tax=Patella caerulea TaxID=87958 RepID=A0AAN8KDY4_PATCE